MSGALDMLAQVATSSAIDQCHGTTDMVRNTLSSTLDADSLMRIISHTVDNTLDGMAEVYGFDKKKAKTLWARTSGQDTNEDSSESRPSDLLAKFPIEILYLLAEHCDKNALWSLCLTARKFVQPARHHLYRDVDLSTHARGLVRNASECGNVTVLSDSLQCRNFPPAILQKQEAFIRTLDVHPEYKLYVHSLRWTILPFKNNFNGWYSQEGVWRFMGSSWQVLGSLTNLRSFDLFDLSQPDPETVSPRREDAPIVQMPHLRILCLGGCIQPKVGAPLLLHQDLAKLTQLSLNNVFMQRPLHDYLDEIVMKHLEGTMVTASSYYHSQEDGQPIIHWDTYTEHAPELLKTYERLVRANTYLGALLQCRSLKSLTFETHGHKCMGEYPGPLPAYLNALGYMLCGMILERNCQTLTHFTFTHGTDNSPSHATLDPDLVYWVKRHISWKDYMFRTYIYSSICRNRWASMKSVVLTGIDSWGKSGFPYCPREFTPIPVPACKALNNKEGMFKHHIIDTMRPTDQLLCVSESRLFDPFEMPKVEQTELSADDEEEEGEVELDNGADEEEGDLGIELDEGGDDEEEWETDTDEDADADAEEYEQDDDSDSVEEIGKEEFEDSQKQASERDELFEQFCTIPS